MTSLFTSHWRICRPAFLLLSLPLLLGLSACTGSKTSIEKASRQKYHGGAAGSGGGNIYRVYVNKSRKAELSVDKVWVGNRETGFLPRFVLYSDSSQEVLRDRIFPQGLSQARIEFTEPIPPGPNPRNMDNEGPEPPKHDDPPYDLPDGFERGVVIWYTPASGKSSWWMVTDFEQLAPIFAP